MLRLGVILSVAVTACSHPSTTLSDLDQEMENAHCDHLVRCKLILDESSCHALLRRAPDPSVAAGVAAHKIDYDGDRARVCLEAIANQSCDVTAHDAHVPPAACGEMLKGRVADGDSCSMDVECGSGTCVLPTGCSEAACCVGHCRATQEPGASGAACDKARDCKPGLVCGEDLTCHVPAGDGQACRSDRECSDGLACVGVTDMPGMCHALPGAGGRCPDHRCRDENLRCDAVTNTCVAVGVQGAPCMTSAECSIYAECDAASHLCRQFPTLGMPCVGTCSDDSFCMLDSSGQSGTCIALLPNNAACDGDQQCISGFCPDGPVFRGCIDHPACF